jgi:2-C-methyl-D-erythritol 2,4-cyclodiphosphate synthase
MVLKKIRTGIGYDIHRLVEGRKLYLGGLNIPFDKGLLGHSDGDVLLHAAADAILGASGLPGIGELFPDTEMRFKNMDSREIFKKAVDLAGKAGFILLSLDAVVICEQPKISPYRHDIAESMKRIVGYPCHINIKGKTNEGLGEIGRGEAIACLASCILIEEKSEKF